MVLLANSSFMLSCDTFPDKCNKISGKEFNDFLDENNIISIEDLEDIPCNYYDVEVFENKVDMNGNVHSSSHIETIERIDNVICQAKEFDYDYKVVKVDYDDGEFEIDSQVVENISKRPLGYDYVYDDDYVISNGYSDVLINYGKILKRD